MSASRRRMSNADAAWLHMDRPTNLMVVNALLWFDEPLDVDRVTAVVRDRLVARFPRFHQRVEEPPLGIGPPAFADDPDFDLDLHIHRIALPAPGDRAALQELAGDLVVRPLDRARPLWEAYVIEGYGEGTALLVRMHHCIADGIALARVLLSLTDERPDVALAPGEQAPVHRGLLDTLTGPARLGLHALGAALREGRALVADPLGEGRSLVRTSLDDARSLARILLKGGEHDHVLRGRPGVARRVAWTDPVPLDLVKAIGREHGATVNDVVLAAITGALHRYLAEHDSLVDEVRVMVPFNLRPLDRPLPRELGNEFGLVYLELPVGIADPRERLAEIHRRMDAIKRSPDGLVAYGILGVVGVTPAIVEQQLIDIFAAKATAVVTNVPGPRRPVWFAGTKVAGVLAWVPAAGDIGLGIAIFSYDGQVTIGLQAAASIVPDPETILAAVTGELDALRPPRPAGRRRSGRGSSTTRRARSAGSRAASPPRSPAGRAR
jgi:WS/DGAT/MGAT family acyltransferase